jgi:acyl carrier protein
VLAAIWAEVLKVPRVGIHDNFFDLGGHSLLAVQMTARIENSLNVRVRLSDVMARPSVSAIAARIETLKWAAAGVEKGFSADQTEVEL